MAEMRILRWMSGGVTENDRIKSKVIRGTVKITSVSEV